MSTVIIVDQGKYSYSEKVKTFYHFLIEEVYKSTSDILHKSKIHISRELYN